VAYFCSGAHTSPDKDARKASLTFYKQHIHIALEPTKRPRSNKEAQGPKDGLTLAILEGYYSENEVQAWHDHDGS
jgi:hypothetical protein